MIRSRQDVRQVGFLVRDGVKVEKDRAGNVRLEIFLFGVAYYLLPFFDLTSGPASAESEIQRDFADALLFSFGCAKGPNSRLNHPLRIGVMSTPYSGLVCVVLQQKPFIPIGKK